MAFETSTDPKAEIIGYLVFDTKSPEYPLSAHKSRVRARSKVDRLDTQYGASRYVSRPLWSDDIHGIDRLSDQQRKTLSL